MEKTEIYARRRAQLQNILDNLCGGSVARLATKIGRDASYVARMLYPDDKAGKKNIGEAIARLIETSFQLPQHYLDGHEGPYALPSDKGNVATWDDIEDLPEDKERVWIDRYDYHFSAGTGHLQWEIREKRALPFNSSFFKAIGSNPKNCKLLMVTGDSMEPFLFHRDMFMVDASDVRLKDGMIYAIYFEDEPLVKQIFKQAGGGIVLHSFNPRYPDKAVAPEQMQYVHVVGQLVYRSGAGPVAH